MLHGEICSSTDGETGLAKVALEEVALEEVALEGKSAMSIRCRFYSLFLVCNYV